MIDGAPPRRRRWLRWILAGCLAALVVVVVLLAVFVRLTGPTVLLFVGVDGRTVTDPGRADAIALIFLDPDRDAIAFLNLPRDLWIDIPRHESNRINVVFRRGYGHGGGWQGGFELLEETVEKQFGVRVDGAIGLDFDGFTRVVDAYGGIDVAVPCPATDDIFVVSSRQDFAARREHLAVRPGVVHMDGTTALMYARSRRGISATQRDPRMQVVLAGMLKQIRATGGPLTLWRVFREIETDLSVLELAAIARFTRAVPRDRIHGAVLTATRDELRFETVDGHSVVTPNWPKIHAAVAHIWDAAPLGTSTEACGQGHGAPPP